MIEKDKETIKEIHGYYSKLLNKFPESEMYTFPYPPGKEVWVIYGESIVKAVVFGYKVTARNTDMLVTIKGGNTLYVMNERWNQPKNTYVSHDINNIIETYEILLRGNK
jgi:hypothetical protein